ncbi:MAG: tyrosine recombinase [Erysipelotrichaceae bacterium]|jgi:integrase/recombinase XerD|nr:tyrosine recombinase [Bacillota bacterium]MDY0118242.1 tyrosine recombinase [Bacilli bacterium]NLJ32843.1 tyrosine recombinase [Erysipelotrichaceae bacterium]
MNISDAINKYQDYLTIERGLSNDTIQAYINDLVIFNSYFELNDTLEYNEFIVNDFVALQSQEGKSASTINRRVSSVMNFLRFLELEGEVKGTFTNVIKPKIPKRQPVYLSIEQVEDLLNAPDLTTDAGIRDRAMLEIMYASGLRVSELMVLKFSNLLKNEAFPLLKIRGKGGKERIIPYGEFAAEYLNKYLQEVRVKNRFARKTNIVFINEKGEPFTRQFFFKRIKLYAKKVGIEENISPHTLRHSFATHLLDQGMSINTLQKLLGHENLSTTQIYTHVSRQRVKSAYKLAIGED